MSLDIILVTFMVFFCVNLVNNFSKRQSRESKDQTTVSALYNSNFFPTNSVPFCEVTDKDRMAVFSDYVPKSVSRLSA